MKSLLTITFLISACFCLAQTQLIGDAVYSVKVGYRPATIKLLKDTNSFPASNINNIGSITYIDIQPGQYKILISGRGQTSVIRDSIFVGQGQKLVLNFEISGPCLYDHPIGYIPSCPENHIDNIVPIIYGLIATRVEKFMKSKKEENVHYGGCVTTDCDPQFYCKRHDIEF